MAIDLNGISVFLAVAEARSFRVAGENLGVTRPAISQAIRRLEDRLGVALVRRTTRSVSLTEAGEQLYRRVAPAISEVGLALDATADRDSAPGGLLRLAVSSIAEQFISGPLLARFADTFPAIQIDVTVTDEEFDIVAEGYDAGVRLGEVIDQDMIAVPVSGEQRQGAFAAPSYIERFGKPEHPSELSSHRCIGWRPAPHSAPYRWEFGQHGREFDVAVDPQITTNDMWLMIRTACAGGGITFGMEDTFKPYVESGQLAPLLQEYCPPFAGFFLYYPSRRNLPPKLRALVDHVRRWR
ncbi:MULTISPECIES: LysR family transcriptional regulator [Rhizobium]|uniref:LysR family transcriptional regulator n=1 Tax=Rhizobium TaxID=379 RepID=UPI001106C25D|nr:MULTISPECIES: LysR family transcriptional regulator [Rhizobium]MBX4870377.1 LysR family transcriptional regulator [Rhizobium bangladeshense]MBX4886920.1 LysR family transcriptional regulator [Rhizobium bangladeshense]MBX4905162.1 LysR family transcriptional regulator [Rhizobium bangladeshense]MBX4917196.1 LysR family transcriptional regulator [Rhizobium bangladeshense]MBY3615775.1 LysR family transcriptional regulator [Rhizobium bangladeshense]